MSEIILYKDKKECCGCGACMNICPKSAIKMQADALHTFIFSLSPIHIVRIVIPAHLHQKSV